ncbi:MOSC domain-containing protein [Aurantimonas sp. C2-4-R8]|uniref:MOSC domain-containing protein n=1 Tax=Aurantimonas sp. C2-4-R8 TaxID=3114364 RepID=UPI002E19EC76|nr:MOSC domain-containing protein [Aurantimonas sp. C2-3-R2]
MSGVLVGTLAPLGRRQVPSGIDKQRTDSAVDILRAGLVGDEQGNKKNHGGPEKAIHHYPFDHYAAWRVDAPALAWRLTAVGAFGENISTTGMSETNVCIGDVYRLGTALVQVSQGRQPCWRLNERFGDPEMARRVQESGRTGWYYRVLEEGRVIVGDTISLVDRPIESWTLERVIHVLYRDTLNAADLGQLAALPHLAEGWRALARRRLERRTVEDWSARLRTPAETSLNRE